MLSIENLSSDEKWNLGKQKFFGEAHLYESNRSFSSPSFQLIYPEKLCYLLTIHPSLSAIVLKSFLRTHCQRACLG